MSSQGREPVAERLQPAVWVSGFLLLFLLAGCATQSSGPKLAEASPAPEQVIAARAVVSRLQAAMTEIMQAGPELGYSGRKALIMGVVLEVYDLPTMARLSYGPGWQELDVEQQALWIVTFTRFHVSSIAEVRSRYRGQIHRMLGYRLVPDGHVLIETQLDYPGRAVDFYTNYLLRPTDEGWKIIDVMSPPSVSEVAMRRAEYQTLLEKGGFSGLVGDMEKRILSREHP